LLANSDGSLPAKKLKLPSTDTVPGDNSELYDDDGERPFTMKELQESLRAMA